MCLFCNLVVKETAHVFCFILCDLPPAPLAYVCSWRTKPPHIGIGDNTDDSKSALLHSWLMWNANNTWIWEDPQLTVSISGQFLEKFGICIILEDSVCMVLYVFGLMYGLMSFWSVRGRTGQCRGIRWDNLLTLFRDFYDRDCNLMGVKFGWD